MVHCKINYFIFTFDFRNVPIWACPAEIQMMAHALSGRRFNHDFMEWFLPQYTRGRGTKNMSQLVFTAAEFLVHLICEVWATQGQTNKIPKGRRKYQVSKYAGNSDNTARLHVTRTLYMYSVFPTMLTICQRMMNLNKWI